MSGPVAKRTSTPRTGTSRSQVSAPTDYRLPEHGVGLTGPVERPAPGTLPLRGDLAHIALAGRYLAAHYVVPIARTIAEAGASMRLAPLAEADEVVALQSGSMVEALDYAGDWAWVACGPEGPSGYVRCDALVPRDAA